MEQMRGDPEREPHPAPMMINALHDPAATATDVEEQAPPRKPKPRWGLIGAILSLLLIWRDAVWTIITVFLIWKLLTPAGAIDICQSTSGRKLYSLPQPLDCNLKDVETKVDELIPTTLQLYKQNNIHMHSVASACKIVKTVVHSFTYFFDNEHLRQVEKVPLTISAEECLHALNSHHSDYGILVRKGEVWQTTNEPDWTYPSGGFSCCKWKMVETINLAVYPAVVYTEHGTTSMSSTAGDASHCEYMKGSCLLDDGQTLVWHPNTTVLCPYLPWRTIPGNYMGNVWLSNVVILAAVE